MISLYGTRNIEEPTHELYIPAQPMADARRTGEVETAKDKHHHYNFDCNTFVSLYADDTNISTIFSDVYERYTMQEHLNDFMRWAA